MTGMGRKAGPKGPNLPLIGRIEARLNALGKTPEWLSKRITGSKDIVRNVLRGLTQWPTANNAIEMADALQCDLNWLLTGHGSIQPSELLVPVVGYVGTGAEIISVDDQAFGAGLEYVDARVGSGSAVAVKVRGESMVPALYPGDVVIYEQQARGDLAHLAGRECVVKLADGREFIKVLRRTVAGAWYLHSPNAEPLVDVTIKWAAPVRAIIRA